MDKDAKLIAEAYTANDIIKNRAVAANKVAEQREYLIDTLIKILEEEGKVRGPLTLKKSFKEVIRLADQALQTIDYYVDHF